MTVWTHLLLVVGLGLIGCGVMLAAAGERAPFNRFLIALAIPTMIAFAARADSAERELHTRRLTALVLGNARLRVTFDVPPTPPEAPLTP